MPLLSDRTGPSEGFYDALGHTIKVARADLGIERAELAERAETSFSYLAEALGLRSHKLLKSAEIRRDRTLSGTEEYPTYG